MTDGARPMRELPRARWLVPVLIGALATALVGVGTDLVLGPVLVARLERATGRAISDAGGRGVEARFIDVQGWLTRRPLLVGGDGLSDGLRARIAHAVVEVPGVGGVHWAARRGPREADGEPSPVVDCQSHVEAILRTRSIRFAEARASIDPVSRELLDEVAAALRPCAGSVIAITGHTDAKGDEEGNLALSRERAMAVRYALAARGIDMAGLRARGVGSERPLPGLDPADPANRRIEFSVIAPVSFEPTVVDTPGAE